MLTSGLRRMVRRLGFSLGTLGAAIAALLVGSYELHAQQPLEIKAIVNGASFDKRIGINSLTTAYVTGLPDLGKPICGASAPLPTILCDVQITREGKPQPMLHVVNKNADGLYQINFMTDDVVGKWNFQIVYKGAASPQIAVDVAEEAPDVIQNFNLGSQVALAIFSDWTIMTQTKPVLTQDTQNQKARTDLTFYMTGLGRPIDGPVLAPGVPFPPDKLVHFQTPTMLIDGVPADPKLVTYVG